MLIPPEAAAVLMRLLEIGERWKETRIVEEGNLVEEWEAGIVKLITMELLAFKDEMTESPPADDKLLVFPGCAPV
jgi:hypothetical protein